MTAASQQSLATDIANAVAQYDFDGISIDDEYSECPQGQQGPGGDAAVSYGIVYSLRKEQKMTGKLITKSTLWDSFAFGKTSKYNIAPLLDAVWTEVYPSSATDLSAPLSGAMTNPQLGLSADPTSDPKSVAQSVVKGGFGYMMLWGTDGNNKIQDRVNTYTQTLLGETNNPNANVQYGSCR